MKKNRTKMTTEEYMAYIPTNDDEYTTRLRDLAKMREYIKKKDKLKRLKEKEYQEELAKLNKKYGRS